MASPLEPNQSLDQSFRVSDLNFTTPLNNTPLPQFSNEGVIAHRDLSQRYRLILEQKDALSIYLGTPSRGGDLEDGFSKIFSTRKPTLISSPAGISPPGWTDVLRNVDPTQLQPDLCGSQRCHIRGAVIDLPSSDSSIIRAGLLQKLLDPWPHPSDLQSEVEVLRSTLDRLSAWKQEVMQGTQNSHVHGLSELNSLQQHSKMTLHSPVSCRAG